MRPRFQHRTPLPPPLPPPHSPLRRLNCSVRSATHRNWWLLLVLLLLSWRSFLMQHNVASRHAVKQRNDNKRWNTASRPSTFQLKALQFLLFLVALLIHFTYLFILLLLLSFGCAVLSPWGAAALRLSAVDAIKVDNSQLDLNWSCVWKIEWNWPSITSLFQPSCQLRWHDQERRGEGEGVGEEGGVGGGGDVSFILKLWSNIKKNPELETGKKSKNLIEEAKANQRRRARGQRHTNNNDVNDGDNDGHDKRTTTNYWLKSSTPKHYY